MRTMIRMRVAEVVAAAPMRRPGYLQAVMGAGRQDGEWVEWDDETYQALRAQFGTGEAGPEGGCSGCGG